MRGHSVVSSRLCFAEERVLKNAVSETPHFSGYPFSLQHWIGNRLFRGRRLEARCVLGSIILMYRQRQCLTLQTG